MNLIAHEGDTSHESPTLKGWSLVQTYYGWRRGRDSNPGWTCAHNGLAGRPNQPLSHLSATQNHPYGQDNRQDIAECWTRTFRFRNPKSEIRNRKLGGGGRIRTHGPPRPTVFHAPPCFHGQEDSCWGLDYVFTLSGAARIVSEDPEVSFLQVTLDSTLGLPCIQCCPLYGFIRVRFPSRPAIPKR